MLEIKNLSFKYNPNDIIFENVTYTFNENRIYGLIGANGAGKTTFFRILLNQITPPASRISIKGLNPRKHDRQYRDQFIFSPDEPQFLPYLTGMEWLLFVLSSHHKKPDNDELKTLIDVFRFPEIHHKTGRYSHGMNKKLSMIINLSVDAYCLLFDESFAGIDPFTSRAIHDYIKSIKKDKIIIISSHNKDLSDNLFDSILFLKNKSFTEVQHFEDIFKYVSKD